MKKSLKFLFLASLLFIGISQINAQGRPGGGDRNMSPEDRANKQTERMTESLALSEKQAEKVGEINVKYALQMKEARDNFTGDDRSELRTSMKQIKAAHNEEISTVLTSDQYEQFLKDQEEMRQRRGEKRGKRKGPKPEEKEDDRG